VAFTGETTGGCIDPIFICNSEYDVCPCGDYYPNDMVTDTMANIIAHELWETMTNPVFIPEETPNPNGEFGGEHTQRKWWSRYEFEVSFFSALKNDLKFLLKLNLHRYCIFQIPCLHACMCRIF
jgi:hypothetical protein